MKAKILVIEDEKTSAKLLQRILEKSGYEVILAHSGLEGIDLVNLELPDLILTDLYLGDIDGLFVGISIKSDSVTKDIPLIMMSADYSEEIVVNALENNFIDFVSKPIRKAELNMRISNVLKLKQREKELEKLNHTLEKEKKLLSKYFSEEFVDTVIREEIPMDLSGTSLEVTTLFFDLRDSTTIAESMEAEKFANFLSELFTSIMEIIHKHKGSVNKLIGDGLMATFGCPFPNIEDARNSILCSLAIQNHLKEFNSNKTQFFPCSIKAGIGIATGIVFAGNIGSSKRMEYTVIGDSVNIASRLESITKISGKSILIDQNTYNKVKDEFDWIKSDINFVKGKKGEVGIYFLKEELANEN
jgi:class 3 adenylate cyclase